MNEFLPISRADMEARGWYYCDFLHYVNLSYYLRNRVKFNN